MCMYTRSYVYVLWSYVYVLCGSYVYGLMCMCRSYVYGLMSMSYVYVLCVCRPKVLCVCLMVLCVCLMWVLCVWSYVYVKVLCVWSYGVCLMRMSYVYVDPRSDVYV